MPFKKLNLDQDKVEKYLKESKKNGFLLSDGIKGHGRHCAFKRDGEKCLLIIFLKKNGTTTIQYTAGTNHELSKLFAEEIIEFCKISDNNSASCTFRNIQQEEFQFIEEFITEEIAGSSHEILEDNNQKIRIIASGRANDKATIIYYKTTKTVLLQGKPLPIFQEIKLFFYELISDDDIIENENQVFDINITRNDINASLREYMPTAINFLDKKIIKIMTPALALNAINIDLDDYTCFSFPALRGIEGYIKQLFKKSYKEYKHNNKIGSLFGKLNAQNLFPLQEFVKNKIKCPYTIEALEASYNLYYSKRHPYFHIDKHISSTPIIESKNIAQAINVEIFATIESTYIKIP